MDNDSLMQAQHIEGIDPLSGSDSQTGLRVFRLPALPVFEDGLPSFEDEAESPAREYHENTIEAAEEQSESTENCLIQTNREHSQTVTNEPRSPSHEPLETNASQPVQPAQGKATISEVKIETPQHNTFKHIPATSTMGAAASRATSIACDNGPMSFTALEQIRLGGSPKAIHRGVELGIKALDALKDALSEAKESSEAARWLSECQSLQDMVKKTRTVVGVLGNTGAGKSSLINALLDEDHLVSTSCRGACTTVATEYSYNHDPDPEHLYRAEVEFLSKTDFTTVINMGLSELVQDEKLSPDHSNSDTAAGIAYAIIKAVFPSVTKEELAKSDTKVFTEDPAVAKLLGTVRSLNHATAEDLKSVLQNYVKTPDKTTGKGSRSTMAHWPLIKSVRVYLKAKVLSKGTVLVDLPGVQDANAARSAVGERYLAECSSLWIVSPIARAIDDKAAKQLLGNSFRQQLTMDGNYRNVTFICSKTDEIEHREIADQLDEDGNIRALRQEATEKTAYQQELELKKAELDKQMVALETALEELVENDIPVQGSKKRKHGTMPGESCPHGCSEKGCIKCISTKKKQLRHDIAGLKKQILLTKDQCMDFKVKANKLGMELRNRYCTDAIRQDFADGIRETMEEAEAMDESLPIGVLQQDYDQLAQSLSVFCVSSSSYQTLKHRGEGSLDTTIKAGYQSPEDTQIPQLLEHALELGGTELGRAKVAFLIGLGRLLRSLTLWVSPSRLNKSSSKTAITPEDQTEVQHALATLEKKLESDMNGCIKAMVDDVKFTVRGKLSDPVKSICQEVSDKMPAVAAGWDYKNGVKVPWNTYRAMCRHEGHPCSKKARDMKLDFNDDLYSPLKQNIAVRWGHFFSSPMEDVLKVHVSNFVLVLKSFQNHVHQAAELDKFRPGTRSMIKDQMNVSVEATQLLQNQLSALVKIGQREANRLFVQSISESMKEIYAECAAMEGRGVQLRMQEAMVDYVEDNSQTILITSLENVCQKLNDLCMSLERAMKIAAEEIMANFKMQRNRAVPSHDGTVTVSVPNSVLVAQGKVRDIITDMTNAFDNLRIDAMED